MFVFKLLHRVFYVKLYYLIFMLLNPIFLYVFLCRIVNNISNNNGTPEVIAEFDVDVFTQETPVKKNKAKKSANILVRNIS